MTGDDLKRMATKADQNAVWNFLFKIVFGVVTVIAGFAGQQFFSRLDNITDIGRETSKAVQEIVIQQTVNTRAIQILTDASKDRYTGSQAAKDWAAQERVDQAQDRDRARIESTVETLRRNGG